MTIVPYTYNIVSTIYSVTSKIIFHTMLYYYYNILGLTHAGLPKLKYYEHVVGGSRLLYIICIWTRQVSNNYYESKNIMINANACMECSYHSIMILTNVIHFIASLIKIALKG